MAKVTATPMPSGIGMPKYEYAATYDISDDLPSDVIGECVAEAVRKAWVAGYSATKTPYFVMVTFSFDNKDNLIHDGCSK